MPKPNIKNPFARRKSSGNLLDSPVNTDAPPQSSFRVIERPEKNKIVLDGPDRRTSVVPRPFASPLHNLRGKSVDDLTYSASGTVDTAASRKSAASLQKVARGSGGTTGSGSSEFYQSSAASARHSSSSTLPSSVEPENEQDSDGELFAQQWAAATKKPLPITPEEPLPVPPSFSTRAQRAFSFGLARKPVVDTVKAKSAATAASPTTATRPPTSRSPTRERALTTSSYASTAVPTTIDLAKPDLSASDFGGSFGDMFEHLSQPRTFQPVVSPSTHRTVSYSRYSTPCDHADIRSQDSPPIFPPKSYSRQSYTPSPHGLRDIPSDADIPYTQTRRTSRDALLTDSPYDSPQLGGDNEGFFATTKQEYSRDSGNASPSLSKHSSQEYLSASGGASQNPSTDDLKRYELRDPQDSQIAPATETRRKSTIRFSTLPPLTDIGQLSNDLEMVDITPKPANRKSVVLDNEPLFDNRSTSRPHLAGAQQSKSESALPKRLTKAQFEILQKYPNHATDSADNGDSGDEYDDVDEAERLKQVTNQRRKQEANMALYRQQMKRVTGGGPTDLPIRPSVDRSSSSAPTLHLSGIPPAPPADVFRPSPQNDDEEDDDIPLAILQAHGFPSSTRAPSQIMDGSPAYRPASIAPRNSTGLPPFARRLPEDPYFGAGIANPAARESLAFGGGVRGPMYGGPSSSQPGTPGGLVGVIANEERQRQARRGSPNPQTGTFASMPLPSNMPAINRASSMPMLAQGMPPPMMMMMPPQMPSPDSAQLQHFMQAQMAMMQNMQNMINMQQAQLSSQMSPVQQGLPRPPSLASNLPSIPPLPDQGRAMSMMGTPSLWNLGATSARPLTAYDPRMSTYAPSVQGLGGAAGGYAPSIAPSERSNVGQPSRYRPVTSGGDPDRRASSMVSSQTLNAFRLSQASPLPDLPSSQVMQQSKTTIRVIEKPRGQPRSPNVENDDDDEGSWGDMFKKRLRGKRASRMSKSAQERVTLGELYTNVE